MTTEEEAIEAAETRITEAEDKGNYEARYKHLVQAHRQQAQRAVELEGERNAAIARAEEAEGALTRLAQAQRELVELEEARRHAVEQQLMAVQRDFYESSRMVIMLVHLAGDRVTITDAQWREVPNMYISSWREEVTASTVFMTYPVEPPRAPVNRCPHVGGPENAECGCSLDFDCVHGGTCETEEECRARR